MASRWETGGYFSAVTETQYNPDMNQNVSMPNRAQLDWQEDGPVSRQFGDVYFSRVSGLEETRHVFLRHNHLAERFAAQQAGDFFTIAETGFGTGLNFLCAWELWQRCAPAEAQLHFVSVEKYPLSPDDLRRALALWPALAPWAEQLLAQYRTLCNGWHRFSFMQGRVCLTLIIGDVAAVLPQVIANVDAWFLDGFAPARNPHMWTHEVLQQVARLAKKDSSFATFTSAGEVRRTLVSLGYKVERVRGHGSKREMLCGVKIAESPQTAAQQRWQAHSVSRSSSGPRSAIVVGAGIAGASVAHALAQRGWQVTVIDRHAQAAGEASGNPVGILYPRLSHKTSPLAQLIKQGFQHSVRVLNAGDADLTGWHPCGVLQLAFDADETQRIAQLQQSEDFAALGSIVDQAQAATLAGTTVPSGGVWLAQSGWLKPAVWCRNLLQHPGIRLLTGHEVQGMQYREGAWEVLQDQQLLARATALVLCTAYNVKPFAPIAHLPVKPLRGQITQLPASADSMTLRAVVCGAGYVSPAVDGFHLFGASFERSRLDSELSMKEQGGNLEILEKLAPMMFNTLTRHIDVTQLLPGRAALRATSPDFMPMVGAVQGQTDLHVSLAHGARGLITAPLLAEVVVSQMTGEPMPVSAALMSALEASRFSVH
jgi:tRNA 5-methylaminomethyl-2-thiouridine biosynthesis bifunctional protein